MPKLDVSTVSDKEAAEYLLGILSTSKFSTGDKDVVCFTEGPDGLPVRVQYKLSSVPDHVRAWLNGTKDEASVAIALREIKYAKKEMAYDRGIGRKA